MHKHFLSAAFAVLGIVSTVAPMSGFAYIDPATAFGNAAPPTQREGEAVVAAQQQRAAERRAEEQSQLQSIDDEPEPVDSYVVETGPEPRGLLDEDATYARRQERMEENVTGGPTIIIGGNATVTDANGNVLHSGAPLVTSTGPESVLAIAAMILAGISTFAYASIRNRRMTALA